jgi:alkylation response protein AidB-like acyl-CoA dehydrogenase
MLSHEQLELRATFRRFAEREIAPNAAEADDRSEYP